MILKKDLRINKIEDLEQRLKEKCISDKLHHIGNFTIMFNEEEGKSIIYVKDMSIETTGGMEERYDKNSEYFNPEYKDIGWPYTGFVHGKPALGWLPISGTRILRWLDKFYYKFDEFAQEFEKTLS